jgi:hypothetical protein
MAGLDQLEESSQPVPRHKPPLGIGKNGRKRRQFGLE